MGAIVYLVFGIIEAAVGLRFLFKLLGANPDNGLVAWAYSISAPLTAPFRGIFGEPAITPGTAVTGVFEWTSLIALVVYGVLGAVLAGLLARRHDARI